MAKKVLDPAKYRPNSEWVAEMREDCSELVAVLEAALPCIKSIDKQKVVAALTEANGPPPFDALEMFNKCENEVEFMFGLVDTDLATEAFKAAGCPDENKDSDDEPIEDDIYDYDAPLEDRYDPLVPHGQV